MGRWAWRRASYEAHHIRFRYPSLPFEDSNSKLLVVVSVATVDIAGRAEDSLFEILKLKFGQALKLNFGKILNYSLILWQLFGWGNFSLESFFYLGNVFVAILSINNWPSRCLDFSIALVATSCHLRLKFWVILLFEKWKKKHRLSKIVGKFSGC